MYHRFSKLEAAVHLGVSPTTISRMIQRGELQVEREGLGIRAKVWVLIEDSGNGLPVAAPTGSPSGLPDVPPDSPNGTPGDVPDVPADSPSDVPDISPGSSAGTAADLELAVLRERVKHLEQLAEERADRLKDSEWRYHELVKGFASTMEQVTKALPPGNGAEKQARKRSWWPFRRHSAI